MATTKQRKAARKNVKKAVAAAKRKKTISHLSKKTRTALGKQGAKVAAQKRKKSSKRKSSTKKSSTKKSSTKKKSASSRRKKSG